MNRIVLALDGLDKEQALHLARTLNSRVAVFKIHDLYDRYGPIIIGELKENGAERVWVDVKLHDIPHTVALRAQALSKLLVDIITVHASGEVDMMKAAVDNFNGRGYSSRR